MLFNRNKVAIYNLLYAHEYSLCSIPAEQQRLRAGFPPKELKPGDDPTCPVELVNGERVSVDIVNIGVAMGGAMGKETTPTPSMSEAPPTRRGAEQAGGDDDTAQKQASKCNRP